MARQEYLIHCFIPLPFRAFKAFRLQEQTSILGCFYPPDYWISTARFAQDVGQFTNNDIELANNQIENQVITSWDHDLMKQDSDIRIIQNLMVDEILFISQPLVSEDERIILVYFEKWNYRKKESFGSGTLTVWTRSLTDE